MYKLSNEERSFFGLDPIDRDWNEVYLKAGPYESESVLYFDGDILKRQIITTDDQYIEKQYHELTIDQLILLPKTGKGKEKKITAAVLEQRLPQGVYLSISGGILTIGNYNTQTTFYSTSWDGEPVPDKPIHDIVKQFIENSPTDHFEEIEDFKIAKRQKVSFRAGDYFTFKISRTSFGFGRILLDVNKIRKKKLISESHGLQLMMGMPVFVQLYAFTSDSKDVDITTLNRQPTLPADVMMDNLLLYGEYEIIGHRDIDDTEYEFPISYGRDISRRPVVFLQWGLIHKEMPITAFNKYLFKEGQGDGQNPYGYYGIGFRPLYNTHDIVVTIENQGSFDFSKSDHYMTKTDLRNPRNKAILKEIFDVFNLDPDKSYYENSLATNTILPSEINKLIG